MTSWVIQSWPPDFTRLDVYIIRALETVAMAILDQCIAAVLALPLAWLAAKNVTPQVSCFYPLRWFLDISSRDRLFYFCLDFCCSSGNRSFAGVLGVGLHTLGSIARITRKILRVQIFNLLGHPSLQVRVGLKAIFFLCRNILPIDILCDPLGENVILALQRCWALLGPGVLVKS